jgi:protein import protein ZIM17
MRSSPSLLRAFSRAATPRARPGLYAVRIPAPTERFLYIRPTPFRALLPSTVRFESNTASPTSTAPPDSRLERDQVPSYELTFTCNVCKTRSSHRLSKQGYHHGTVLIQCPGCKNRHLISDHLKVHHTVLLMRVHALIANRSFQTSLLPSRISCAKRETLSREAR